MIIKKGETRTVILIWRYAIKIPVIYSHLQFLKGCRSNYQERMLYKNSNLYLVDLKDYYCPSLFCTWFGLLQIQRRCLEMNRDLTDVEKIRFKGITTDFKKENFGFYTKRYNEYKNNYNYNIVCLDYA